ncbi:NAD(P)/FAD-dependent oxidoreductase [Paraburkholderia sp. BR13439]|uniref:NAD(P)/FAD-dependent oxidoreductase n=1 Tax=Paraburkholderia sp. BR13439 TaxID=3236996 RepID=UPI0034CFE959
MGAGIVGLAIAHELAKRNLAVTVVDKGEPAGECSGGNAGALSYHSFAPLALPGVLSGAIKMMCNPKGPLYVPPLYFPFAASWLFQFVKSAEPARVYKTAESLEWLLHHAPRDHKELATDVGFAQQMRQTGQLHLYPSEVSLAKDAFAWALKSQLGMRMQKLDRKSIREIERDVSPDYVVGLLLPDDHWLRDPLAYARAIADAARLRGVAFERASVTTLESNALNWVVRAGDRVFSATHVVLASGAWSNVLLRSVGLSVPLETQRGYHLHVPQSDTHLSRTIVLADRKVFITPMESGLRIAGTVEFGGTQRPGNERRATLLEHHARAGLPSLNTTRGATTWMGHRPCMPDSMPVLGQAPDRKNLWLAFGHGHLGLTGSAPTAKIIADCVTGRPPQRDQLGRFSAARFGKPAVQEA